MNNIQILLYLHCTMIIFMSFLRLFAIGSQLSPEVGSSGIEMLETDMFKLHCFQTLTGLFFSCCKDKLYSVVEFCAEQNCSDQTELFFHFAGIKFIILADPRQSGIDTLLRKIYEIYSDFALKNPFYSLEMPIRCVIFFSYNFVLCMQSNLLFVTKKIIISFRCELFDQNLKSALEIAEKAGTFGPGS